jgi:hypothetical protein
MSEDSGQQQPDQPQEQPGWGQQPGPVPPSYPPAPPASGANPYAAGYTPPPPGWTPQPGVGPFPTYVLPDLPKATTALVLGIVAVAGAFMCLVPVLVAPVAWILGAQARKEIRAAPQQWGGDGRATAGMVLGIIGTVLLVLGLIVVALFVIVAVVGSSSTSGTGV